MLTGIGHRDQAVGRVRPRALSLPKLLSATLESIHPETPPPHPSLILTRHQHHHHPSHFPPPAPPDMHIHQTYANSSCISIHELSLFLEKSFSFISLISAHLVPAPLLFSSPLSSILLSSPLSSSFPAVMEIRLEKSLIL